MILNSRYLFAFALLVSGALCTCLLADEAKSLPNIVVILADDLGYGDVACYNRERGKIPTPHIDSIASQGMMFTDAHSSSGVCSPSRYTLLTGRYHWRSKLQDGIVNLWGPPLIAKNRKTVGDLLTDSGYQTACFGKWHLGWKWPIDASEKSLFRGPKKGVPPITTEHRQAWEAAFSRPIEEGPTTRGFGTYFGTDVPNWPPYCFIDQEKTVGIPTEFLPTRLVGNHLASVQGPSVADWKLEEILPTLATRTADFIRAATDQQRPFFVYVPLTSPHTPVAVSSEWRGKSGLNSYADFVMETDAAVGTILKAIDDQGVAENTLVLFTSDNGCTPSIGVEDLQHAGHYPSGPLRGYKADVWEGGHRVPFIVRWPHVVESNSVSSQLVHQADIYATCADLLGRQLDADVAEDSFSILPLLNGQDAAIRQHAVSQSFRGLLAVRKGKWKLIFGRGSGGWARGGEEQPAQLYDLSSDLGESTNLYTSLPDKVEELMQLMEQIVEDGRSNEGPTQDNDTRVDWLRFMPVEKG